MFGFRRKTVNTLTPQEVQERLAAGTITLVDVREPAEWADGRIPGAVHVPLSAFAERARTIPEGKPVVFYCLSGGRSGRALALCKDLGLAHDTHMAGGISAWRAQGLPVTR
ncbi:rhodanese-like domain-containing protein [Prosthecomicrobium sp. N25]|uniref:rhodanese-like domain-containing protein n=1 Tax=Prosthecomicrobium sp. N25 TaxID=3129254 RepID=UPI003077EE70